jgi:hypothetical protein
MFLFEEKAPLTDDNAGLVDQWQRKSTGDGQKPPLDIKRPSQESLSNFDLDYGFRFGYSHRDDESEDEDVDFSIYHNLVTNSLAYGWLTASLGPEATLIRGIPDLLKEIEENIIAVLPPAKEVRRNQAQSEYKATLILWWDFLGLFKEQEYSEVPQKAVQHTVTLAGCANEAQALTTRQDLTQTWLATDSFIMDDIVAGLVCCDTMHCSV